MLERSLQADTTAWQIVATETAGLTGSHQYSLADLQPAVDLRYYRLVLRRPDGSIDYTGPSASDGTNLFEKQDFPNPIAGTEARLSYPATTTEALTISIYNELGRLFRQTSATVRPGLNMLPVNVDGLLAGV